MDVREFVARLGLEVDTAAFEVGDSLLGKLKKGLFSIQGAALAGAGALATAVGLTAKEGGALDDLSKSLGINVESLQSLAYAGKFSGVSVEEMAQSLAFLGKNAYAASQGSEAQAAAFQALGISVKNSDGKLKDSDTLFREMADGLAKIPDAGQRTAIAMQLMGRAGKAMLPTLVQGRAEIERLEARGIALGAVMDKDMVASADALGDSVDDLMMAFKGIRNAIAGPLLKPITEIVTAMTDWFVANHEVIKTNLDKWLGYVGKAINVVWRIARPFAATAWAMTKALAPLVPLLMLVGAGFLFLKAVQAAGSALTALSWVVALTVAKLRELTLAQLQASAIPILWALAIGVLLLILEDLWTSLNGGNGVIAGLYKSWSDFIGAFTQPVAGENFIVAYLRQMLKYIFDVGAAWEDFKKEFNNNPLVTGIKSVFSSSESPAAAAGGSPSLFGGGASPMASVANAPGGTPGPTDVKLFQPKIELSIDASGTAATPEELATAHAEKFEEVLGKAARDMDEGLP